MRSHGKAVGIDRVTWEEYGAELDSNLELLVSRLKRKKYKPIPALENKAVIKH